MPKFKLVWSPEGRTIDTVQAKDAKAAIKKTPAPYSKYKGEVYAEEVKETTADQYRAEVSKAMKDKYGITWQDACGDAEPLQKAQTEGMTPGQFVAWWAEKYDLDPCVEDMIITGRPGIGLA